MNKPFSIAGSNDGVVADVNGDGIADVGLTAYVDPDEGTPAESQGWIYLSHDGGLTGPTVYSGVLPGENWPGFIWFGDIDSDGLPDLLVSTAASLDVFMNQGGGTFGSEISIPGCNSGRIRLIDANGDGRMDVVELTPQCGLVMFLNTGDGGYLASPQFLAQGGLGDLAVGDFDADGITDLAFDGASGLEWLKNGPGGFMTSVYFGDFGGHIVSFTNGSGDALASVNGDNSVSIYTAGDAGPWLAGTYALTGGSGGPISAGDVNGDGLPDLLISDGLGIAVLLNQGNAVFGAAGEAMIPSPDSAGAQTIGAGDLDGDGAVDLVIFRGDGPWEGWINTCGPGASALLDAGASP